MKKLRFMIPVLVILSSFNAFADRPELMTSLGLDYMNNLRFQNPPLKELEPNLDILPNLKKTLPVGVYSGSGRTLSVYCEVKVESIGRSYSVTLSSGNPFKTRAQIVIDNQDPATYFVNNASAFGVRVENNSKPRELFAGLAKKGLEVVIDQMSWEYAPVGSTQRCERLKLK